jgi:RND family efflux transporter MFP subunit
MISAKIATLLGRGFAVIALAVALAAGCQKPPQQGAPPPSAVTVSKPIQHMIVEWDEYDGHIYSPLMVSVAPQVSGQVIAEPFDEGKLVDAGQALFKIDPVPFRATLEGKRADMAKSEAQMESAQTDFDRYADALKSNAVSKQVYDTAKFALDQAKAQFESDKAAVDFAQNNLNWCNVTAPITGLVGQKEIKTGNVVNAGGSTPSELTTIQSIDPMYCLVDVDEASARRYAELQAKKQVLLNKQGQIPCYVSLDGDVGFPHAGYIDFFDNKFDATTGTRLVRGVFPNPPIPGLSSDKRTLIAGNHALMRIAGSPLENTLLVPDAAIGTNQDVKFVLVATPGGDAIPKPVQLGALFGPLRAIRSGLSPDDDVIINGQARVIPGRTKVAATPGPIEYDPSVFAMPEDLDLHSTTQASDSATQPGAGQ